MSGGLLLVLYILCAVGSAFFSSAETAITSLTDASIFRMKSEGRRGAERLERLRADLPKTLGTILVGNTLANAAAGSLGAGLAIAAFGDKWGVLVATILTAILLLVVSEVTPKTLAARRPEALAVLYVGPVETFVRLLSPATTLLSAVARWILGPFGVEESPDVTEEDVKSVISLSREQGGLKREESELLHAVLAFGDKPVREAMVPRARIVSLDVGSSFARIEAVCREHRYSRYPVTRGNEDDVIGILHVKDLFDVSDAEEATFDLSRNLRPAIFVPELKRAEDLLREMRRRRFHMAIVVGESGAVAGLVTLEDLIEEIVGDIFDEHDEPARRPVADGTSLLVEGAYPLPALERDLAISFGEPGAGTVAGFLLRKFGRIPRTGARVREGDVEFLVERATPRAIERVRILRSDPSRPAGGADNRKALAT
ncbi:MAG TPA: hemolysin family protein [Thermoanaerobaculia bacterium]|nr:hemolysin family protein [Thermoanaerobaculia bacterium]